MEFNWKVLCVFMLCATALTMQQFQREFALEDRCLNAPSSTVYPNGHCSIKPQNVQAVENGK